MNGALMMQREQRIVVGHSWHWKALPLGFVLQKQHFAPAREPPAARCFLRAFDLLFDLGAAAELLSCRLIRLFGSGERADVAFDAARDGDRERD